MIRRFGCNQDQISYLLREALEELRQAYPHSPDIPPTPPKKLILTAKRARFLLDLYKKFVSTMVSQGRHLTTRQEGFLKKLPLRPESQLLHLYLGQVKASRQKRKERKELAQGVLATSLAAFSRREQSIIRAMARGKSFRKIFDRKRIDEWQSLRVKIGKTLRKDLPT